MHRMHCRFSSLRHQGIVLLAILGPVSLAFTLHLWGERTSVGALMLLAEPLFWVGACHAFIFLILTGHWRWGAAFLTGSLVGAALLRSPTPPQVVEQIQTPWTDALHSCASQTPAPSAPIRVLGWTLEPGTQVDLAPLLAAEPDLVILHGIDDPEIGRALAEAMGGEAKVLPNGQGGGVVLAVRGAFQACGGPQDTWEMPLPSREGRENRIVVTLPLITGVGAVPLITAQLEGPGPASNWGAWPSRLLRGAQRTAAVTRALDSNRVLLLGDMQGPTTFPQTRAQFIGAGLQPVRVPPTWPTRLGPLPLPPLQALDQLWGGSHWAPLATYRLEAQGQVRAPFLVDLGISPG